MSAQGLQFDADTAREIVAGYTSPDVVATRCEVLRTLGLAPGEAVLDVGSGPGLLLYDMGRSVGSQGRACGVDTSASMNALARERCAELAQCELREGDAAALPFEDGSFDAAASIQVYEYVADVDAALGELYRVLRPGGRACVMDTVFRSVIWHASQPALLERLWAAWKEHAVHDALPFTLGARMRAAGFAVLSRSVVPMFSTEGHANTYATFLMELMGRYVTGRNGITAEEVEAFKADQRALAARGEFFFCLNRYVFLAVKPQR